MRKKLAEVLGKQAGKNIGIGTIVSTSIGVETAVDQVITKKGKRILLLLCT